ncbi:hypothetical protein EYF80_052554 [Liparis tanakae]|uniref:Uncharacterized protein n=1 Tax=Liparis tanakae TaxID=230148 RepID=A0A4Z2F8T5_9TELE|nr:hypothetical protein EYF80_052554 [Liparis tanakae]
MGRESGSFMAMCCGATSQRTCHHQGVDKARRGKLPVAAERTLSSVNTSDRAAAERKPRVPPGADPLGEAAGAERQAAVPPVQVSSLLEQGGQAVGVQLGGLPCGGHAVSGGATRSSAAGERRVT